MNAQRRGQTALMIAAEFGDLSCVKLLVSRGADVNMKGDRGQTALMSAAYDNNAECVKYLVVHGADVNMRDNEGNSALDAAESGNRVFETRGAGPESLGPAAHPRHWQVIAILKAAGAR